MRVARDARPGPRAFSIGGWPLGPAAGGASTQSGGRAAHRRQLPRHQGSGRPAASRGWPWPARGSGRSSPWRLHRQWLGAHMSGKVQNATFNRCASLHGRGPEITERCRLIAELHLSGPVYHTTNVQGDSTPTDVHDAPPASRAGVAYGASTNPQSARRTVTLYEVAPAGIGTQKTARLPAGTSART